MARCSHLFRCLDFRSHRKSSIRPESGLQVMPSMRDIAGTPVGHVSSLEKPSSFEARAQAIRARLPTEKDRCEVQGIRCGHLGKLKCQGGLYQVGTAGVQDGDICVPCASDAVFFWAF